MTTVSRCWQDQPLWSFGCPTIDYLLWRQDATTIYATIREYAQNVTYYVLLRVLHSSYVLCTWTIKLFDLFLLHWMMRTDPLWQLWHTLTSNELPLGLFSWLVSLLNWVYGVLLSLLDMQDRYAMILVWLFVSCGCCCCLSVTAIGFLKYAFTAQEKWRSRTQRFSDENKWVFLWNSLFWIGNRKHVLLFVMDAYSFPLNTVCTIN